MPFSSLVRAVVAALAVVARVHAALTPRADSLMLQRGLRNLEEAADLYDRSLDPARPDPALQLRLADALNGVLRIRTHSNTLVVDRLLDTPENKAIWAQIGPRALELAKAALDARKDDVRAAAVYADAYMFACSSKGIIKQALQGAASVFKANAERIIRLNKRYDSGVGYALLGAFYTVAPWPYGNLDKAAKQMDLALKVGGKSRRNLYYAGVVAYKRKQWDSAVNYFRLAHTAQPGSPTEQDFSEFMESECLRAGALAQAESERASEL